MEAAIGAANGKCTISIIYTECCQYVNAKYAWQLDIKQTENYSVKSNKDGAHFSQVPKTRGYKKKIRENVLIL